MVNNKPLFKQQSAIDVFKCICNEAKIGSHGELLNKKKCLKIYRRMSLVYPGMTAWTFACFFDTVYGYSGSMCEVVEALIK